MIEQTLRELLEDKVELDIEGIIRPGFSQLMDRCPNAPNRPITNAMRQLDHFMELLIDQAKLAA